ncbi:flagellar biosynthetic protein FliO [Clostridium sp. DL1XJH146]
MARDFNFISSIFQMIFALIIVLLIIYCVSKIGGKYTNKSVKKNLKILDRLPLSNKSSVCVVKVGEEVLLLGVTENNINVLDKLPDNFVESYLSDETSNRLNFNKHDSATVMQEFINKGIAKFRKDNK